MVVNILALPDLTLASAETIAGADVSNAGADISFAGAGTVGVGKAGSVGTAGIGFAEADMNALPAPMYLEKSEYARGNAFFWFGVLVVVVFVLSGLFAFRAWYMKRTGLAGGRGRPGYAGL